MGHEVRATPLASTHLAGQLLVRPPLPPPCVVTEARFEVDPAHGPYYSFIPHPGDIITESSGYVDVGAVFRFRGGSSSQVSTALEHTLAGLHVQYQPIATADAT